MAEVLAARQRERQRLIGLAREHVRRLSERIPVVAAAVAGSVARGDFNVWSDVDLVVISDELPARIPDRGALLAADAPAGVQAVGYTRQEFHRALAKGDPLATSVVREGVVLRGGPFFREAARGTHR